MNEDVQIMFFKDNHMKFSSETKRSYTIALRQFFTFVEKPYDTIKAGDIRGWMVSMEANGLKPKSIQLKLIAVKTFYRYCMEENLLKKSPTATVKAPKKEDSLPYYLDKRELTLLQEHTKVNKQERAIVEALYATGARISELLNIKLSDIKWETRQIWIQKGKGNKERFVLFTHDCEVRLKVYLDEREFESEYLFCNTRGNPLNREFVQGKFREYKDALGFRVSPHTIRHTFAAHLAEKDMPQSYIQELLGHVNINSTRIYTRLMEHARKRKYDQYQ